MQNNRNPFFSTQTIIIFILLATNILSLTIGQGTIRKKPSEIYKRLNPQLKFRSEPSISKADYVGFRNELIEMIDELQKTGQINRVAVFFRDLQNGPAFGINEYDDFAPASLLKLPLMLTYFRLAEDDPSLLNRKLVAEGFVDDLVQKFAPAAVIEQGKSYTIDELLYRLIVHSDNRAWDVLYNYLTEISPGKNLLLETYHELGMVEPQSTLDQTITVKSYAYIFRLLYNATYLSNELSDKALDYLTQVQFDQGLERGIPADITLANKFGERFTEESYQMHDCGIIYYPQNPYLLCIMTKGPDPDQLVNIIKTLSERVYNEVDSRRL